ncbi:alginate lyase family protein [Clostridium mediterraneense]|uniref:alginate lyase family protein n=1 Tax=Clostridium mediterraneense TaxID=1805472 RepID=UPI00082D4484|nr:alginate lyase family protein [Clostridium mediterraneense]
MIRKTLLKLMACGAILSIGLGSITLAKSKNINTKHTINEILLSNVIQNPGNQAIVVNTNNAPLVLYSNASTSSNISSYISVGEMLTIQSSTNGFYKVEVHETGAVGYIAKSNLQKIVSGVNASYSPINKKGMIINVSSVVHLRQNATMNSAILNNLRNKTNIDILGKQGQWYKVSYNGSVGFIYETYIAELNNTTSNKSNINNNSSGNSNGTNSNNTNSNPSQKNNINIDSSTNYTGLYNINTLRNLNNSKSPKIRKQVNSLISSANKLLKITKYPTVTDKTILVSNGENKHDFASMTPYLWNDPNSKSGYIVKDGVDNPERLDSQKYDSTRLNKMVSDVNTLSLAYAITGNKAYANQASNFIKTWFINPETKMDPNMKYAEIFVNAKGQTYFSGSSMISASPFISVVNDIYLIQNSNCLSSSDNTALKEWFGTFANWLLAQKPGGLDRLRINNHGTWLQAELATFYQFAGQYDKALKALEAVGPYSIFPQINQSGKIPSALIRTKSVAYTEYDLQAFITLATMGEKLNVPIWNYTSPDNGSIKGGIHYLNKYLLGEENWPFQNIKGNDVAQPNNQLFMLYLAMAYNHYKDPSYLKTIYKYATKEPAYRELLIQSFIQQ